MFLTNTKLRTCDRIISNNPFSLRYIPNQYKTKQMCNKAVDDCLAALKFVPDWFVTNEMMENFLLLYTQMKIYSILMKTLVISHLFVME